MNAAVEWNFMQNFFVQISIGISNEKLQNHFACHFMIFRLLCSVEIDEIYTATRCKLTDDFQKMSLASLSASAACCLLPATNFTPLSRTCANNNRIFKPRKRYFMSKTEEQIKYSKIRLVCARLHNFYFVFLIKSILICINSFVPYKIKVKFQSFFGQ